MSSSRIFNVSFWSMAGELLGTVPVQSSSPAKAKVLAASLYVCSWSTQTAEPA